MHVHSHPNWPDLRILSHVFVSSGPYTEYANIEGSGETQDV